MPTFQTVRGMRDILDKEAEILTQVICKARETATRYGYKEVVTPIVEPYELLSAKSGEEIRQRMFIFKDLGERMVALRPEFTSSIARLATTSLRNEPKPLRVFSVGSVYRYDEPQRGRYREFWQSNFELMGSDEPEADAEMILLTNSLMKTLGLNDYTFKIGHIGILRGILSQEGIDENTQNAVLQRMDKKEYDQAFQMVTSPQCRSTLEGLLTIKSGTAVETIEKLKAYLAGYERAKVAAENLQEIFKLASESGCQIENVEPAFARGLEYYTGMIFEVNIPQLDIALGGGGRYDRLIEVFGGEPTPAVGVAHGIDRITLALQMQKTASAVKSSKKVLVIPVSKAVKTEALKIAEQLRKAKLTVEFEVMGRKMAKALEDADKRNVDFAVIVGERELRENAVVLKDLAKREQSKVTIEKLAEKIEC